MASSIVNRSLEDAERLNPTLNSFLSVEREHAAERLEQLSGSTGEQPLYGMPIAIKDNICTKGMRTSCASRILENYKAQYDATAIERLNNAGAVVVGKTNMDEFAMGSSNENSAFGPAKNPWDTERVPGGSSGGSAVAVASGVVRAALGSETGGSVRQPASLCGIIGLKPTYGRISRYGLVAFASSLDNIGIFGQTSADTAKVLSVIAGRDEHDSTSADVPVPYYEAALDNDIKGKTFGVPRELFAAGLDDEVRHSVEGTIDRLKEAGANIVDIELPNAKYGIAFITSSQRRKHRPPCPRRCRHGYRAEDTDELRHVFQNPKKALGRRR